MLSIISDSGVCIKKDEAEGVGIVPLNFTVDGKPYAENFCDCNGDFETLLAGSAALSTSGPNIAAFLAAFKAELKKGNEILCITLSSRLSGTFQTALAAAKQAGGSINVFDSRFTGGGQYLLVKEALAMLKDGASCAEIIQNLTDLRERVRQIFTVEDITPLRESGRMGNVRLSVGCILSQRPIMALQDGLVEFREQAKDSADVIKKALESTPETARVFVINHIGYERLAANMYNVIKRERSGAKVHIRKCGPVMGIVLGQNAVSLAYL